MVPAEPAAHRPLRRPQFHHAHPHPAGALRPLAPLAAAALGLLTGLGLSSVRVRAFALRADDLLPAARAYRQLSLDPGDARARAAEAAADRARRRFGPEAVRPAALAN